MSQEEVIGELKKYAGTKYTASELKLRLDSGTGIYENLKRLRPVCTRCKPKRIKNREGKEKVIYPTVFGSPKVCAAGHKLFLGSGVRCAKGSNVFDNRGDSFFYWWQE